MLVVAGGNISGKWPSGAFLGETSDFEVLTGDLDGDGSKETIVVNHDGTGNGLAVRSWSVFIFARDELENFRRPLTFGVVEYGSRGIFLDTGGTVRILTTKWVWDEDRKGKRGPGLYLTGKMWRYRGGSLSPVAGRSVTARRYLTSFQDERMRSWDDPRTPHRWLTDRRAEKLEKEPPSAAAVESSEDGIITDVNVSPAGNMGEMKIVVEMQNGERRVCAYPRSATDEQPDKVIELIGENSTGVIYPSNYLPARPEKWLKGRRCKVVKYVNSESRTLWLV